MKGKTQFTIEEAEQIKKLLRQKRGADSATQKGLRKKLRDYGFYLSDFTQGEELDEEEFTALVARGRLSLIPNPLTVSPTTMTNTPAAGSTVAPQRDETYVIDLCDEVLGQRALRQHRFDFLRGDAGDKLPVDAYYPALNLVIEYRERQHTEAVAFFDKPDRMTVSGVNRGEQRRLYDQRRRDCLAQQKITLLELPYSTFAHGPNKRLLRRRDQDRAVLQQLLAPMLK